MNSHIHTRQRPGWLMGLALASGLILPLGARAGFYQWDAVELPAATGASCGNGTPFRFFVNRTPLTSKTVVIFEGGGACWEQNACQMKGPDGKLALLGATNFQGVSPDYMTNPLSGGLALNGLITPFAARLHPLQSVQTQRWNIVYVPYCTGDVHTGNRVNVYTDTDATQPLTYHHKGAVNGKAVADWLGKNLKQPDQLLVTGFSAGGAGATANYGWLRLAMAPKKSAMLADSGPLFQVPRQATPQQAPSVLLHNLIRDKWGLDGPNGLVTQLIGRFPAAGTAENLGSISTGLATVFPQDRLNYSTFQQDGIYSAFSYQKFYPEITAAPSGPQRDALINAKWRQELTPWIEAMKPLPNIGYYVPFQRDLLKSHTLTTATFGGTAIKEAGIDSLKDVVDDLIDGKGTPIRAFETARNVQNTPVGPLDTLLAPLYKALGL